MKLKRLLTGVLSAVMALSVCAMPALAADDENNAATPKTGTLTITKYEQPKGTTGDDWQEKNIGNPLEGVTFTVYKVADVNQTVDASGNVSLSYDLVDTLTKDGISINWDSCITDTEPKQYDSAKIFNTLYGQLTANDKKLSQWGLKSTPKTTDAQGVAKFESLETGVYMVEETSAPTQITSRTANFMVSIPMTVTKEDGTQEITYNVEAEPKNVSTYGGVTLNKFGQVAGSTSQNFIAGAVFQLYRDNGSESTTKWEPVDLTSRGIKVDGEPVTDENAKIGEVTTTTTGVNITGLTPGKYKFMEISAPAGYIADTKTEHKFTLNENSEVIVDDRKVEGGVVDVVNEKPDFEKVVTKRDGTKDNHNADYGIGDKVPYTLTVTVPSAIGNMKTFYVTDTINTEHTDNPQLAYDKSSFKVSWDGVNLEANKDYTLVFTKAENKENVYTGFKIDFKGGTNNFGAAYADKTITISYTAELLDGAVTTKAGNINKAELVYSNKTNIDSTVEEPESDKNTIHDESVVYTFKTSIYKTGAGNAGALTGVKFDLYKVLEEGTDYTKTADGKMPDTITFRGTPYNSSNFVSGSSLGLANVEYLIKVATDVTTENGNASVSGLPKGTYYWVETKALDGYNLLTEPVKADLQVTYKAKWITKSEYENGKLVKHEYSSDQTEYPTATVDKVINIVNRKGFTLPVTGGFGTLLFSGIGVLLVLAGVCVLFSMKKKNNRA